MEVKSGYKQTDVGIIPEDWSLSILKNLVDPSRSIRYGIVQPGKYDQYGRYMIRGQDYSNGWVDPSELFRVSAPIEERYVNARVRTGDVLITIVGASTGHVAIVPSWLNDANLTQTTARIAVDNIKASGLFCSYILSSKVGSRQVQNYMKGGAQPGLNCGDIEKFLIPLPPTKAEQEGIAEALSDADALIEALEQLITKKRQVKQGAMQELLTGKRRLPEFSKKWETKKLGDVFEITAGGDFDPTQSSDVQDEHFPYPIYSNAITDKGLYGFCSYNDHQAGSITVTARGTLGAANYRDHDFTAIGRVIVLKPIQTLDGRFISEFINNRIDFVVESTGVPQLTAPQISKYEILFPEFPEQTAIAEILSDMDAEIAALEGKLSKARQVKQGMMSELLTGRVRLL